MPQTVCQILTQDGLNRGTAEAVKGVRAKWKESNGKEYTGLKRLCPQKVLTFPFDLLGWGTMKNMPETYSTEMRELIVTGHLWDGHKTRVEYTLKDGQNPVTIADAKRIAGDFASIEKARIRIVRRQISETTEQIKLT